MAGLFKPLLTMHRVSLTFSGAEVRTVTRSVLTEAAEGVSLVGILANKAPEFYRPLPAIIADLQGGFPLITFKETLARLPQAESFRSSHLGEILACVFGEEVLGLRRIYSKLSLLTAENANAFKMDLVLYDPSCDPVEIVLGEVKTSPKHASEGMPAGHDQACYSDTFRSLRDYADEDLLFDLGAAKDRLPQLPFHDQDRVRQALQPYSESSIRYAAFVVIDDSTFDEREAKVLGCRSSPKEFNVDLIGVSGYSALSTEVFSRLQALLEALRSACS